MLFPEEGRYTICEGRNCPNKNANRTRGICIKKQQNDYICVNSDNPSVIIIFRDPTIENNRNVPYVLDINYVNGKKVSSRLFNFYNKHLLNHFPEGEIVYLDNFIRCPLSIPRATLSSDYWRYSSESATCCNEITNLLVDKMKNLKCLIFSSIESFNWLICKGLLHFKNKKIIDYIKEEKENSTVLLDECFNIKRWDFPIFYFPHPSILQYQYGKHYAPNKKYYMKFKNGRERILQVLK